MFTGIIEEIGLIKEIEKNKSFCQFSIETKNILKNSKIGDSIDINGVCLTIKKINNKIFKSDIIQETLNKTNLRFLKVNQFVNLERAMTIKSRFDGHIVQGHIEGVAKIISLIKKTESLTISLKLSEELLEYCIYKGSIAVNGVSLTIAKINKNVIDICLIPHTLEKTTFTDNKVGDLVNIETDLIAKYIKKYQNSYN